jgi:polyvinyl alcohol dehydrogenase (cytochrome)
MSAAVCAALVASGALASAACGSTSPSTAPAPSPSSAVTPGPETTGPVISGSQTSGSQTSGSQTAGSQTSGSQTASPVSSSPASAGPRSSSPGPSTTATAGAGSVWAGYHADQSRTGAVAAVPNLDPATRAWSVDLGGAVFGQPVIADGRIVAATEGNRVVALDPADGHVVWSRSIGSPLTDVDAVAGCGDIDPLGITSTPVVDDATGVVYVVGEVSDGGGKVHHQLEGLSIATGAVTMSEDVDPPLPTGETPVTLLQRAALALGNGRVYVSYGGNAGDCGVYHGWVVGVRETGAPQTVSFEVAADGEGGAIWESGGAPALDPSGDLYVTTGNANPDPPQGGPDPKKYTESVVELTPDLRAVASFKDTIAGGDEDLATGNPILLPDGMVFAVGKTDVGYLLSQHTLTKVAAITGICGSDPDGGPAYDRTTDTVFVPCKDGGIQEVDLAARKLGPRLEGANGAPILVGSDLWAAQYPEGTLTEFDPARGSTLQTLQIGSTVPHFVSPSVGLGLILIGTDRGVTAFR